MLSTLCLLTGKLKGFALSLFYHLQTVSCAQMPRLPASGVCLVWCDLSVTSGHFRGGIIIRPLCQGGSWLAEPVCMLKNGKHTMAIKKRVQNWSDNHSIRFFSSPTGHRCGRATFSMELNQQIASQTGTCVCPLMHWGIQLCTIT